MAKSKYITRKTAVDESKTLPFHTSVGSGPKNEQVVLMCKCSSVEYNKGLANKLRTKHKDSMKQAVALEAEAKQEENPELAEKAVRKIADIVIDVFPEYVITDYVLYDEDGNKVDYDAEACREILEDIRASATEEGIENNKELVRMYIQCGNSSFFEKDFFTKEEANATAKKSSSESDGT